MLGEILLRSLRYEDPGDFKVKIPEEEKIKETSDGALYYVVGATIRFLQGTPNGCRLFKELTCQKTDSDCVEICTRKWTELQDRGGLIYAKRKTFEIFKKLHCIATEFFTKKNKQQFDRKVEARKTMTNDKEIQTFWMEALKRCGLDNTVGDRIFGKMIDKLLNTVGNGHVKNEKDDMKAVQRAKNQKARAKKPLRKQLEDISNH